MDSSLLTIAAPKGSLNRRIAIFYLHGGGLLYGERDDLPTPYVNMLLSAGYTIVSADYPLAPESCYSEIIESTLSTFSSTVAQSIRESSLDGYFLFGRSSGANLALVLAREIGRNRRLPQPLGIIDFYGYYDLCDNAICSPAKAYQSLPEVSKETVSSIVEGSECKPTSGPKSKRYALYVYARQHENAWLELMGLDRSDQNHSPEFWSLSDGDIAKLPPLFITASSGDEDIPLRMSKSLRAKASNVCMKTVYYLPHDFDRDTSEPTGAKVYKEVLTWMQQVISQQ